MEDGLFVGILFLVIETFLAIGLIVMYFFLRNRERDTLLDREVGLKPQLNVIGSGRINTRQWARGKGCRISVYDDFLVVSAGSQRLLLPLGHLTCLERVEPQDLIIEGLSEDERATRIVFRGPEAETLQDYLRQRLPIKAISEP